MRSGGEGDTTGSRDMGRKIERSRHNVAQRYTDGGFSARAAIGFHMQHVQFQPLKSESLSDFDGWNFQ